MKRVLPLLILIVSFIAGYRIISIWQGVHLYQKDITKERLLKATRLTSFNPDPYYRLGILYQWDIRNLDLKQSLHYFEQAIERNPIEQEYWLNAARSFQRTGKDGPFRHALENAVRVYPTSFQGRWVAGNLLLQQGDLEGAIPQFSYILSNHPDRSLMVYNVWMNVARSPEFILERLVPRDSASLRRFLAYLYQLGDKVTAKKTWEKKMALGERMNRDEALHHIDFLVSQGELHEAFRVWKKRLQEENLPVLYGGNLVTNSGFEKEEVLGGGFDWKIQTVPGALISFDRSVAFEGKGSLKIVFNGKENVDFQHVSQVVALKPNTDYLLTAYVKTKGVTTKSGVKIEISGVGVPFHAGSESLIGDNGWKELVVPFHTPPQSQGGVVRLRREPTEKFDRFISGLVWVDNFRLTEKK